MLEHEKTVTDYQRSHLTKSQKHPAEDELPEFSDKRGAHDDQRPEEEASGKNAHATCAVGEVGYRKAAAHQSDGEYRPKQKTLLRAVDAAVPVVWRQSSEAKVR